MNKDTKYSQEDVDRKVREARKAGREAMVESVVAGLEQKANDLSHQLKMQEHLGTKGRQRTVVKIEVLRELAHELAGAPLDTAPRR